MKISPKNAPFNESETCLAASVFVEGKTVGAILEGVDWSGYERITVDGGRLVHKSSGPVKPGDVIELFSGGGGELCSYARIPPGVWSRGFSFVILDDGRGQLVSVGPVFQQY